MADSDLPYAYDLFNRITGAATVNGEPLGAILLDGTHNLWHCFAQAAFIEDCVAFSRTKKFADVAASYQVAQRGAFSLKYFLVGGFAFLVSLVSVVGLRFGPPRVLVYSVDRLSPRGTFDFRIENLYRELARLKAPYVEVYHTVIGKRFLANLFTRRRAAIYLEGLEWAFYLVRAIKRLFAGRAAPITVEGLEAFTDDERRFAEALVTTYVSVAPLLRYRANFLTAVLRGRIRTVFAIDDARHYHEVVIAAKRLGVTSYALQHSHVTPYHVGWLAAASYRGAYARSDYYLAWNEYWKDELFALNAVWPADAIIIAGSPKESSVFAARRAAPGAARRVVVVPYETHAPVRVVRSVLTTLLGCAGVSVIIKIRPDLARADQLASFGALPPSVRVVTDLTELTEGVTAVLGTYSTFLYDAAEAGLPVGLVKTPLAYSKRMVMNGLADEITVEGACRTLERLAALTDHDVAFRQKVLAAAPDFATTIEHILVQRDAVG